MPSYSPYTLSLVAESTVYQNEVRCRVKENDFNYTLNQSALKTEFITVGEELLITENDLFLLTEDNDYLIANTPTLTTLSSDGTMLDNITGSEFHPYVTTVGLYNDRDELLVVGKLSRPYPVPPNTDMTFIIRWDS